MLSAGFSCTTFCHSFVQIQRLIGFMFRQNRCVAKNVHTNAFGNTDGRESLFLLATSYTVNTNYILFYVRFFLSTYQLVYRWKSDDKHYQVPAFSFPISYKYHSLIFKAYCVVIQNSFIAYSWHCFNCLKSKIFLPECSNCPDELKKPKII